DVHRHRDHAEPGTRLHELDVVGAVREQKGQTIADAAAALSQLRRDASDALVQLTKRRSPAVASERRPLGIETCAPAKRMGVHHRRWPSNSASSDAGMLYV